MSDAAWILLGCLLVLGGVMAVGWLPRPAPTVPDPARQLAAAALTPDAPLFTDAEQAAIDEIAGVMAADDMSDEALADEVNRLLADLFPPLRPAIPQEES